MSPVIAGALRRGAIVAGSLAVTILGHILTGAELRMLAVAPLLWVTLVAMVSLPGFARRARRAFVAWSAARLVAVLAVGQLAFHAVLIEAPWALGLIGHHHGPLLTGHAVAIHVALALVLALVLRHGEQCLVRAMQMVAALLAPLARRSWPRIRRPPSSAPTAVAAHWPGSPRTSRGPPPGVLLPAS
jgi:hypothetical protein